MARKTRRKKRGHGFSDAKREYLTFGKMFTASSRTDGGYNVTPGAVNAKILADADAYGPDLVAERIASRPGIRPWVWWMIHLGIPVGHVFHLGAVSSIVGMPPFEYLARNDLLNSAEQNRLFNTKMEHLP